jgi:hypothetical protein
MGGVVQSREECLGVKQVSGFASYFDETPSSFFIHSLFDSAPLQKRANRIPLGNNFHD